MKAYLRTEPERWLCIEEKCTSTSEWHLTTAREVFVKSLCLITSREHYRPSRKQTQRQKEPRTLQHLQICLPWGKTARNSMPRRPISSTALWQKNYSLRKGLDPTRVHLSHISRKEWDSQTRTNGPSWRTLWNISGERYHFLWQSVQTEQEC